MIKALIVWINSVIFKVKEALLRTLKDSRREVVGAAFINIGVLCATAAVVSESFIKFSIPTRILAVSLGFLSFAWGVIVFPNRDKKEDK